MRYTLATLGACLALAGTCAAQSGLQKALEGTRPRQECARDDKLPTAMPGVHRELSPPDLSCALEPAAVRELLGKADVVVVDTRRADEYAEFHIDGAINMDWNRIRVSPFHGTHTIVMVGSGKAERSLYVACGELRGNGGKGVHVLRGGMSRWLASGQQVVGRAPDPHPYLTLSDEELLAELSFDNNRPFALPRAAALREREPRIELLARGDPAALKQALARHATVPDKLAAASVVLLTGGARGAGWREFAAASAPLPLLVYEGTPAQFGIFMRQKRATWAAQDRGPLELPCGL